MQIVGESTNRRELDSDEFVKFSFEKIRLCHSFQLKLAVRTDKKRFRLSSIHSMKKISENKKGDDGENIKIFFVHIQYKRKTSNDKTSLCMCLYVTKEKPPEKTRGKIKKRYPPEIEISALMRKI